MAQNKQQESTKNQASSSNQGDAKKSSEHAQSATPPKSGQSQTQAKR